MPRLSRAESQARNRERVLEAARELFLRDGYQATSLAAVADAAGFSTGVVYSNFASKAELALPVLREIQTDQFAALLTAIGPDKAPESRLDGLRRWTEDTMNSGWPRLELEFALDARTDTTLVAAESDRQRVAVDAVAEAIRVQLPGRLAESLPVHALADAVLNLAYGIAVRRLIDPNVNANSAIDLLRPLLAFLEPS
ncbi:TetR family transcriptional regulator [Herbihabitans rhizosphaerae]|uniref:TetR family transcriptional regulator n=1 Tax=Herbihabitans rhizosphaerae TaxID=1872711 RepID=A0A4Q7KXY8_9PSEU|nr:TetR/AcrR family transcriptional regulator [Herbihabitans rhizosphaerae]RZS40871.1 TetR family transcriptional regulator [Herbihabitans rhizosphaerae]